MNNTGFKVSKVTSNTDMLYDIEVEDNNNFFANDILVHNCGFLVAKKKYAMRVLDNEGVRLTKPKMKVMGLEIVRSSTPMFCRDTLKKSIDYILDKNESEIQDYIIDTKKQFMESNIEDISRVSGVTSVNYDLNNSKSIPINSRASVVHNQMIEKFGIENDYESIQATDKIKYVLLKVPNPAFNQNVIAYKDSKVLEELKLYDYIDYDLMFEKFFLSPMRIMLDPIGWSSEKQASIDEWM